MGMTGTIARRRAGIGAVCLAAAGLLLLERAAGSGSEPPPAAFMIIVNPANPDSALERSVVAALFLKKLTHWESGEAVLPVDLPLTSATREAMTEAIHGKSLAALRSYWQRKVFSGRGQPPSVVDTETEVVVYVMAHPGAIGYVSASTDVAGAKTIEIAD